MSVTRRGLGLAVGTVATLLLASWVSAAGPVGVFARQDFSGPGSKAPGEEYGPGAVPLATDRGLKAASVRVSDPWLVSLIGVAMKLVLAAVVVVVLVAVGRALRDRWHARTDSTVAQASVDVLPEALLESARESEQLLARGTPSNAVIAAWVALEDAVRGAGVLDDGSRTSTELVTTVLRSYRVDRAPLDTLAALYREARFSRHPIAEDQRTMAREALLEVQAELRRTVARRAQARAERASTGRASTERAREATR
ncbi:hypothetical protein BJ986_002516 [Phycicoccus badiiscoriae]|uniref:Protein-glutamine gamma-glutamyltransferase-like C-terminal domain-containing protein n=1 Tax=Pedococcus badiiscoriae TaxID=642776 RepID=A0A852WGY2_9MICO|nr:DUF4129 domain-containing protein [Pedococcus badiiscoriae]NYG08029.1 hypothetical protein [Pedococcus badiiscoriae]